MSVNMVTSMNTRLNMKMKVNSSFGMNLEINI